MATAAATRRPRYFPLDVGVGLVSMFLGACIVGWSLLQATVGGMIAATCGSLMVFVGGAWTRKAFTA